MTDPVTPRAAEWFFIAAFGVWLSVFIGWRLLKLRKDTLTWCKWGVATLYAAIALFYSAIFILACVDSGVLRGLASLGLVLIGLTLVGLTARLKPQWERYVYPMVATLIVSGGALLSKAGGDGTFLAFVVGPLIAVPSILLAVVAWKDGNKESAAHMGDRYGS